jgi:uncharacterized protein (TIGR02284 family)
MTATKTEKNLHKLVDALQENEKFYQTAANNVISSELQELFRQRLKERSNFAAELAVHADFKVEEADDRDTIDALQRGLMTIMAAMTIERDKTDALVIEESLAAEKKLLDEYRQVIAAKELPPTPAELVQRQLSRIESAYAYAAAQSTTENQMVVLALFLEIEAVRQTIPALTDYGIAHDQIVVIGEETAVQETLDDSRTRMAAESAGAGALGGGTLGGLVGLILGATISLAFGPVMIVGLPALAGTAVLGTAAGASFGAMIGALLGWGVAEDDVHYYIEGVREGQILVAAQVEMDAVEATIAILKAAGGQKITTRHNLPS